MSSKRYYFPIILLCTTFLIVSSCATARAYDPQKPTAAISLATEQELRHFGMNNLTNPYMDIKSILGGWQTDTTVIKISLNVPTETRVYITADMKAPNGESISLPYYRDALIDFWNQNTDTDTDITIKKMYIEKIKNIRQSCMPSFTFMQNPGEAVYYLPFIGNHPIRKPARLYVQVSTGSGEPTVYTATLE